MKHDKYEVLEKSWGVEVKNVTDFDPVHIFECGQCFRWNRESNGSYTGVAKGMAVNVNYADGVLQLENTSLKDFFNIWFDYFDLGRDYSEIKNMVAKDDIMKEAVSFGSGIRLLRQDFHETVISFIISANNMIPRIKQIIAKICRQYGDTFDFKGVKMFSFPSLEKLALSCEEELSFCKAGYRCRYIVETSKMLFDNCIDTEILKNGDSGSARKELMKLPGVGSKVADCILLYSGTRYDVFPTDVWVRRVMGELYLGQDATLGQIQAFAREYFGPYAGFAQQYLFYFARENKLGVS